MRGKRLSWSEEQDQFLIDNYNLLGLAECARILSRGKPSILHRASRLKVIRRGKGSKARIILKDGYLWVRGYGTQEALHRIIWEFFNRPLKKGELIHHKDGNKFNNDPKNLGVTNRHEHPYNFHKDRRNKKNGRFE